MNRPLLSYLVRYPSAGLLFVQLLGILLYPLMENTPLGRAAFGAFGVVVLVSALRIVNRSPTIHSVAFVLAAAILVLTVATELVAMPELRLLLVTLEAAFYFYAAAGLIGYMMEDQRTTTDELFAVGATFTLLAWAFAYAYAACQLVAPGSFVAQLRPDEPRTWLELLFLSVTVLSGVGLGDILPLRPFARALVMLEEIAGLMYIALVVSRVIGLTIRR
ncbi:two pore domain potassium channel family protein [Stutzerimonas balearica]|uniref:two pore domain potassium channel family protein n=1 Tax=Stutzerimonas balearica TaxID=74829 RepID=UPI0013F42E84|nr:two pore domain potassium channel family protein [Stutzerimonas balearica]QIJ01317.1 two pore domain potassium channel family protein [Stutzerimonas balearica]